MIFRIRGTIYHKNGDEEFTFFETEADDKTEAKFFFAHGVHLPHVPEDAESKLDFRTLKGVKQ